MYISVRCVPRVLVLHGGGACMRGWARVCGADLGQATHSGLLPLNVSVSRTNASFVLRTRIFSDSAPYTVVKCALGRASARSTRLATRTREIFGL